MRAGPILAFLLLPAFVNASSTVLVVSDPASSTDTPPLTFGTLDPSAAEASSTNWLRLDISGAAARLVTFSVTDLSSDGGPGNVIAAAGNGAILWAGDGTPKTSAQLAAMPMDALALSPSGTASKANVAIGTWYAKLRIADFAPSANNILAAGSFVGTISLAIESVAVSPDGDGFFRDQAPVSGTPAIAAGVNRRLQDAADPPGTFSRAMVKGDAPGYFVGTAHAETTTYAAGDWELHCYIQRGAGNVDVTKQDIFFTVFRMKPSGALEATGITYVYDTVSASVAPVQVAIAAAQTTYEAGDRIVLKIDWPTNDGNSDKLDVYTNFGGTFGASYLKPPSG